MKNEYETLAKKLGEEQQKYQNFNQIMKVEIENL